MECIVGGEEELAIMLSVTVTQTEVIVDRTIGAGCFCWLWGGIYEFERGEGPGRARLLVGLMENMLFEVTTKSDSMVKMRIDGSCWGRLTTKWETPSIQVGPRWRLMEDSMLFDVTTKRDSKRQHDDQDEDWWNHQNNTLLDRTKLLNNTHVFTQRQAQIVSIFLTSDDHLSWHEN